MPISACLAPLFQLASWKMLRERAPMRFSVELIESEEGFAICCPALPGCWSQGATREEALTNIREAIELWQEVATEDHERELAGDGILFHRELVTI